MALGIRSVNGFHKQSGVSPEAITSAEAGTGSPGTRERLEAWLDRFEAGTGADEPSGAQLETTFETISGGGLLVVRGDIADVEQLEPSVVDLAASIRASVGQGDARREAVRPNSRHRRILFAAGNYEPTESSHNGH